MKKNVKVIDGAINSAFEIYEVDVELFDILFPNGNDIAFASDFPNLDKRFYSKMLDKKKVNGIHGTLHLEDIAKESFPNRRETDAGNL